MPDNLYATMAAFQRGQVLVGLQRSYRLIEPAHRRTTTVWIASPENGQSASYPENVVIKTASQVLLRNEMRHLTMLRGHHRIRQMIDSIESPPSIVLEHAEEDLRSLSIRRKLHRPEIKTIALQLLEALSFAHSKNIVHTDMKPQNILLSGFADDFVYSKASVKLADWASASHPSDYKITPKSFRSPESWLGLPWGPAADIWSFGAIIGSLMIGPWGELFGSSAENEQDAEIEILRKQNFMTGRYPPALIERAGGDWPAIFRFLDDMDRDEGRRTWRWVMEELQIPEEDGAFIERVLKIDAAERPTADTLLQDEWFDELKS